ncbi:MAG: hypothetical protein NZ555_08175 [Geminicoccaceae bacterium]|nr:hypothetical protein [Geminicoccaceae bacterium]MCX8101091.1 hypothetical protein [Geminicoccaceae bacterium]MDW8369937.1 hypothetical protein [Geminicoccaceae bacterium]
MSGPDRMELRHDRLRHGANLALCLALLGLFGWHTLKGVEGASLLLLPALVLFGATASQSLAKILDRRPVLILDREGVFAPAIMARPLPWRELRAVEERRFGRTRLFLYVDEPGRWLRPEAAGAWSPAGALGKLLPGFERPRITIETVWLDRPHPRIREAVAAFWGAARAELEREPETVA